MNEICEGVEGSGPHTVFSLIKMTQFFSVYMRHQQIRLSNISTELSNPCVWSDRGSGTIMANDRL